MDPKTPKAQATQGTLAILAGAALTLGALVSWFAPALVAGRFRPVQGIAQPVWLSAGEIVVRQHGLVLLGFGLLWVLISRSASDAISKRTFALVVGIAVAAYLSLCGMLSDWLVDDAAITFAYSENLVVGNGLVLYPGYPPQEAYSNTLWMLLLAGLRALGMPIPLAAKLLGTLTGVATIVLAAGVTRRLVGPARFLQLAPLLIAILLQAPYIVWSISGLEHGLQGLGYLAIVGACAFRPEGRLWPSAILAGLIFLRPEIPLIVACVWGVFSWRDTRQSSGGMSLQGLLASWPIAVVPALCLFALLAFRLAYFGDLMPTPFYAKAGDATFLKLVNPLGGGWGYIFDWSAMTGMLAVLPVLMFVPNTAKDFALRVMLAIVAAHLSFVIYAGGDWMECFRFMAALVPLLAVLTVVCFARLIDANEQRRIPWLAGALTAILLLFSARALVEFRADPTTPMSVVTEIADEFVSLADRLGVSAPVLAHHDAGGSSYLAKIRLVDLGGLGDRDIAKNWNDPEFMRKYLFETKKPTFIFGAIAFAARRSHFPETREFRDMYVRVIFEDKPVMGTPLCHVRRDVLGDAPPGLHFERDDAGSIVSVTVDASASS